MTRIDDLHGHYGERDPKRLYRDPYNGWFAGVCAGIADYISISAGVVRLLVILLALFGAAPLVLIAYLVLAVALPKRPRELYRGESDEAFWRSVRTSPGATCEAVRGRFRGMERRLQRMERYVTSERYDLEREFRDLER